MMREGLLSLEKKRLRRNVIVIQHVKSHFKEGEA